MYLLIETIKKSRLFFAFRLLSFLTIVHKWNGHLMRLVWNGYGKCCSVCGFKSRWSAFDINFLQNKRCSRGKGSLKLNGFAKDVHCVSNGWKLSHRVDMVCYVQIVRYAFCASSSMAQWNTDHVLKTVRFTLNLLTLNRNHINQHWWESSKDFFFQHAAHFPFHKNWSNINWTIF